MIKAAGFYVDSTEVTVEQYDAFLERSATTLRIRRRMRLE